MRIPRVHADAELGVGAEIRLDANRSHYLKNVLRLKPGAALFLFDGREAIDYRARLSFDGKQAVVAIEASLALATESARRCHLVMGLARADHTDWAIQKTTELGVSRITLFNARRTQSPLNRTQAGKKTTHWRAVAASACEQCGRAVLPAVEFHPGLGAALDTVDEASRLLLHVPLTAARAEPAASTAVVLGPEGGLDDSEIDDAIAAGCHPVSLGPRVLRCETAATAALALLQAAVAR